MMYSGPRKLLFSQVSLRRTSRILLVDCTCYFLCPSECKTSSEDERSGLSPPPPPSQKSNNMPMLLILMLCILGTAFVILCYLTILKRYKSNLSNSRRIFLSIFTDAGDDFADGNHGPVLDNPIWYIQTAGLPQSAIDSIPVFKYKKGDGLVEGADCSVCLSEFEDDGNLRLLPKCSHAFHLDCIDTWLRSHKSCPLCRAPIVNDDHSTGTETEAAPANPEQPGSSESGDLAVDEEQSSHENGEASAAAAVRNEDENIAPLGKILERNNGIRVLSDLGDHRVRVGEDFQSVRRSFSMDLSSASRTCAQVAKIETVKEEGSSSVEEEVEELKKQSKVKYSSSINRSRKTFSFGPIRMKRSFSSTSGSKSSSFHRDSRSQELVQTL